MEHFHALSLCFLEMTFIFVGLALMHNQRQAIGRTPFHMAIGLLVLFAFLVSAADIRVLLFGTRDFQMALVVIYLPILAAYLMSYITEGTLAAQRFIIGTVVVYGLFLYLGELTRLQCNWFGFSISAGLPGATLDTLLGDSRSMTNRGIPGILLELFLLPIFYTRLRNFRLPRAAAIPLALVTTHLAGSIAGLFFRVAFRMEIPPADGFFLARLAAELWLGLLVALYFAKIETEKRSTEKRGPLDILFAFVGSYGRNKELEENLRDWENRYRIILENAGELIVMTTPDGRIANANIAAGKMLGAESPAALTRQLLFPRLKVMDPPGFRLDATVDTPRRFRGVLDEKTARAAVLDCSITPIQLRGETLLVLIGRDITDEVRLVEERQKLADQFAHAQRIESLGLLAGGIAHDFNNYIHAILGHVDLVNLIYSPENPDVTKHLEKIASIAEQAGHLTSQLLGFARKGKYHVADLDVRQALEGALSLLGPQNRKELEVSLRILPGILPVRADAIQLQQVLLNLMINADDAMATNPGEKHLTLLAGPATHAPLAFKPPPEREGADPADYLFILVGDNGGGMSHDTLGRIFEPFFTTKPVGQGTGMGLAMVYGTVSHHLGWVQVDSAEGKGTRFCIFLPAAKPGEAEP